MYATPSAKAKIPDVDVRFSKPKHSTLVGISRVCRNEKENPNIALQIANGMKLLHNIKHKVDAAQKTYPMT